MSKCFNLILMERKGITLKIWENRSEVDFTTNSHQCSKTL